MIAPVIDKCSVEYPSIHFITVDVDNSPKLSKEHGIRAMPTFVIYKDGQKVDDVVQGASKEKVEAYIQKYAP
ncbi:thioredoxin [Fusarium beomiforme]|uniref:Thioredoxin n=1 Tax=Fusarium beomiforme TaxID=44412 RepID=A0A9P5AJ40_9HYPO|nr:thioredoxin [Fusarium beomiforme]